MSCPSTAAIFSAVSGRQRLPARIADMVPRDTPDRLASSPQVISRCARAAAKRTGLMRGRLRLFMMNHLLPFFIQLSRSDRPAASATTTAYTNYSAHTPPRNGASRIYTPQPVSATSQRFVLDWSQYIAYPKFCQQKFLHSTFLL